MGRGPGNAADVDARGLCTECGSCEGICPFKNVRLEQDASWRYRVRLVNPVLCEKCPRVCLQVCPGYAVDMDALNRRVFNTLPRDAVMGNYRRCYIGGAPDPDLQPRATSGGVASGLIAYAVESGRAQGAYLVHDVPGAPFSPRIELARTRDDIRAAAGAKYWPVPLGKCLGEILRSKSPIVFLGLPCEIMAMRKAEAVYPALRDKIAFSIGLCCGRRATAQGHAFVLERLGISPADVTALRYRDGAYPGHLAVYLQNGTVLSVPRDKQLPGFAGHLFLHQRCLLCHDGLSELADIVVGDVMGIKAERQPHENSVVMTRTELGASVLQAAADAGAITLRPLAPAVFLEAKKRFVGEKRYSLWARLELARRIPGLSAPDIRLNRPPQLTPRSEDYIRGAITLAAVRLVQHGTVRAVLKRLSDKTLARYTTYGSASGRVALAAPAPEPL